MSNDKTDNVDNDKHNIVPHVKESMSFWRVKCREASCPGDPGGSRWVQVIQVGPGDPDGSRWSRLVQVIQTIQAIQAIETVQAVQLCTTTNPSATSLIKTMLFPGGLREHSITTFVHCPNVPQHDSPVYLWAQYHIVHCQSGTAKLGPIRHESCARTH